jgi:hypothetical protein
MIFDGPAEGRRCLVLQTRMRTRFVVVPPPVLDNDAGLGAVSEPLHGQAFVAEFAIKGLVRSVLPRFTGIDEGGLDCLIKRPFEKSAAREFGLIIRSQVTWGTTDAYEPVQDLDKPLRAYGPGDIDGKTLAGELIDHG